MPKEAPATPATSKTQSEQTPKRYDLMFCRWLSMIMCGLVAAAIWLPIAPLLEPLLSPVHRRLGALPRDVLLVSVAVTAIAVCWPFGRGRWRAFFGVRHIGHFFRYPPLWVAMASGVLAFTGGACIAQGSGPVSDCLATLRWAIDAKPIWHAWPWGIIVAACLACHYFDPEVREARKKRKDRKNSAQTTEAESTRNRFEELANKPVEQIIEWLKDDKEVTHPDDDYFGHDDVARRIASRLKQDPTPSIAVIGEKGSGKSTIYKLTEYRIENDRAAKHILMVRISLWPYQSPEAAVNGIISELIRKLSTRVNTLALAGLGERYANSVEHLGGFWATMARLACRDPSPERTLKALDRVASAIGVKLILWIEDLERFANADQLTSKEAKSAEAERLSPIRALLHLLDRCDRLSVIVADTSLGSRFDLVKIVRYIENVPVISTRSVWKIIHAIRGQHIKDCLSSACIDPAPDRREPFNSTPPDYQDPYNMDPHAAVASVLREPRNLKAALQLARDAWEPLAGEIDIDDTLMISAIRAAYPNIFATLVSNKHAIRPDFRSQNPEHTDTPSPHISTVLKDLFRNISDPYRCNAAQYIISILFPATKIGYDPHTIDTGNPQGLACNIGPDVFNRYISPNSHKQELHNDQTILRSIYYHFHPQNNPAIPLHEIILQSPLSIIRFSRYISSQNDTNGQTERCFLYRSVVKCLIDSITSRQATISSETDTSWRQAIWHAVKAQNLLSGVSKAPKADACIVSGFADETNSDVSWFTLALMFTRLSPDGEFKLDSEYCIIIDSDYLASHIANDSQHKLLEKFIGRVTAITTDKNSIWHSDYGIMPRLTFIRDNLNRKWVSRHCPTNKAAKN